MGHSILMGRKTFESIGKPLPGRQNLVVTRTGNFADVELIRVGHRVFFDDEPPILDGDPVKRPLEAAGQENISQYIHSTIA